MRRAAVTPEGMMQEDTVFDAVKRSLAAVLPDLDPASVSIEAALVDLGCTSVDRADVVALTMEDLGITVPIQELAGIRNIRGLVTVLARHV